jgi:hypothetical protein
MAARGSETLIKSFKEKKKIKKGAEGTCSLPLGRGARGYVD